MEYTIKPGQSISVAMSKLRPGAVLQVRGGDYFEKIQPTLYPGTADAPITVRAYPGERPVVHGLIRLNNPSYYTWDGVNCQWPTNIVDTHAHLFKITGGVGWTLRNSEIWDAHSYAGLLICGGATDFVVSGNRIHDTYKSNSTNQDHLIYVNAGSSTARGVIERNLLYGALNGECLKIGGADANQVGTHNLIVRYNTLVNAVQGVLISWKSSDNAIYRNLIGKMAGGCVRAYELSGTHNLAHDNLGFAAKRMIDNYDGGLGISDGGGNIYPCDPQFADLTDFRPTNPLAVSYGRWAP